MLGSDHSPRSRPDAVLERLIRYRNLERALEWLPNRDDAQLAPLLELDPEGYRRICASFEQRAEKAARELLDEADVAADVDRLPLQPGAQVLGVGDSMMADRLSFLEILRHALALRRSHDRIQVVNDAVSGDRSCDLLARAGIFAHAASWTLCLVGTNDAMRVGWRAPATVVSLEESARNLAALERELQAASGARMTWIAPPSIDAARINQSPALRAAGIHWRAEDVEAIRDYLRDQPDSLVLDLDPEDLDDDGLHPSPHGHRRIFRALVAHMAR